MIGTKINPNLSPPDFKYLLIIDNAKNFSHMYCILYLIKITLKIPFPLNPSFLVLNLTQ